MDIMANGIEDDVGEQLKQKDCDLILAAELGKALLDKNEELSRQNERITEEYTQKLEVLEQEKYLLRRKLDAATADYDVRVAELQADICDLHTMLEDQQKHARANEKEKCAQITELTEQNHALTAELVDATRREEKLTLQIQSLKDQYSIRKCVLSDQVNHLENLRDEITFLSCKKADLERKMDMIISENNGLSLHLQNSAQKIQDLERHSREQELKMASTHYELNEIKSTNQSLTNRLELLNRSMAPSRPLFSELECSSNFLSTSVFTGESSSRFSVDGTHEDFDYDENKNSRVYLKELKEEMWLAYYTILNICQQLKSMRKTRNEDADACTEVSMNSMDAELKPGLLNASLDELKILLRDLSTLDDSTANPKSQVELEMRLHSAEESLERSERNLNEKSEVNKRLNDQISQLTSKLTVREAELQAVKEERDIAKQDLMETHLGKDSIVKKAWEVRDQAVQRKNKAEIEVARTRIEMMQGNSLLMEAVQQKIQLSEQLEQWQVDMQQLLDEQMRTKLFHQEANSKLDSTLSGAGPALIQPVSQFERKRNKLFAVFRNFNS